MDWERATEWGMMYLGLNDAVYGPHSMTPCERSAMVIGIEEWNQWMMTGSTGTRTS